MPDSGVIATAETKVGAALDISQLEVRFRRRGVDVPIVRGIDLTVARRSAHGIAGESGSGKTISLLAALGLTPPGMRVTGSAHFDGQDLIGRRERDLRRIRGRDIGVVFQDPFRSLHPMLTVETQLTEHMRSHLHLSKRAARARAADLLRSVHIPNPTQALRAYPHEFSGGMRQRLAIAIALACEPKLLIADEPTTDLDVTVQAGILGLLAELRLTNDFTLVLISHDFGVLASICDAISILYAGTIVESGTTGQVLHAPRHPYTHDLLGSLPAGPLGTTQPIAGASPEVGRFPSGCPYHPRCAWKVERCTTEIPDAIPLSDGRRLACPVDPYGEK